MKLELKHLAPYLPYELKIKTKHGFDTMETLNGWLVNGDHEESYSYEDHPNETLEFKPILRPLSDLISLINIDFEDEKFKPIDVIIRKGGCHSAVALHVKIGKGTLGFKYFDLLLQWHFDVFGLIDAGLAIDINTL
jgi:hypothetical protein